MKKTIKLWYTDFYEGFKPSENYLHNLLSKTYDIILEPKNPDYLFYSCYGKEFLSYNKSVRIFYTGENLIPDFNLCDYAIGFCRLMLEDRYLRYPNFALIPDQFDQLLKPRAFTVADLKKKDFFCNFIYSNAQADPARDQFFHLLNEYKNVMSPGSHLNNVSIDVGGRFNEDWMYTKLEFQSKCKFSIAFENSSSPGYTTEKLMHCYITNTIPIYWGNPEVERDFNPDSLVNCHEFKNFGEVVERVKEIDQNDELALQMLNEDPFPGNFMPRNLTQDTLSKFLKFIFDQDLQKAYRRPRYGTVVKYENALISNKEFSKKKRVSALKQIFRRR